MVPVGVDASRRRPRSRREEGTRSYGPRSEDDTTEAEEERVPRRALRGESSVLDRTNDRENMLVARSYADASKKGLGRIIQKEKIRGRVVMVGKEGWKTSPYNRSSEILVTSTTEGGVAIMPKTAQQGKLLTDIMTRKEGLNIQFRQLRSVDPMLRISGVEKGLTDSELVEKLRAHVSTEGQTDNSCMKVIRRIECQNPWKENVLLQTEFQFSNTRETF